MPHYNLLTTKSAKFIKRTEATRKYSLAGLILAPHSLSGNNVCPEATIGCRASCLIWFSGRRVTQSVRAAALRRTRLFFDHPQEFKRQLNEDLARFVRWSSANNLLPVVRLNTGSDLDWRAVADEHPSIQFADYTKVRSRYREYLDGKLPANMQLTYSAHENIHRATLASFLRAGGNIAQVYTVRNIPQHGHVDPLPETDTYHGYTAPVVDGDKHDIRLREIDGSGVIVGLRLKGTNRAKHAATKTRFSYNPN